jgi:hypothetical protein
MKKLQALVVALGLATGMTSADAFTPLVTCYSHTHTWTTDNGTYTVVHVQCYMGKLLWDDYYITPVQVTALE